MTKLSFIRTDDDGEPLERVLVAYVDGYAFGDRLLEGVHFGFSVTHKGDDLDVFVDPNAMHYFKKLDQAHWFAAAKAYALDCDIFLEEPHGEESILLYDFDKPFDEQINEWDEVPKV